MTKRDSTTADLASPRDLRMASEHETDVPMTLITSLTHPEPASGYTSHSVPIPMPLSSSSSTPNFQTFAPLQPSQWRQESSIPTPSRSMSMEMGLQTWWWKRLTRRVTLVAGPWNTFNGIVGHVLDRRGDQVGSWHQASQLASCWHRHFGVAEDAHPYSTMISTLMMGLNQLMWTLCPPSQTLRPSPSWPGYYTVFCPRTLQATILSALSTASPASPDLSPLSSESLNHDGVAHLAAHQAILASVLAQHRAASSDIPDDNST